jgi:hypothetical protein
MARQLTLLTLLLGLSLSAFAQAQSGLPPCPSLIDYWKWSDCFGHVDGSNIKYSGEFKDGKFDGWGLIIYESLFETNKNESHVIWKKSKWK